MAAITWTDVTNHASELTSVAVAAQTDILAHVNTAFTVDELDGESGPMTKLARIYLAAHLGTLSTQGGAAAAGPVIEEEVGDVRRRFADLTTSATLTTYEGSSYGKLLNELLRRSAARAPFVV